MALLYYIFNLHHYMDIMPTDNNCNDLYESLCSLNPYHSVRITVHIMEIIALGL